jgi:hypothetical protein
MVALVGILLLILALAFLPFSLGWFYGRRETLRWHNRWWCRWDDGWYPDDLDDNDDDLYLDDDLDPDAVAGSSVFSRIRKTLATPDLHYVEGVGYVIGDLSCRYNAISSQLRCAVNPQGPCSDCSSYEPKFPMSADQEAG